MRELNKALGTNNVRLAIIGNKLDLLSLQEQRNPPTNRIVQEAIQFADSLQNARHYLTSAKQNSGVAELFESLARRMIEQSKRRNLADGSSPGRNRNSLVDNDLVDDDLKVLDRCNQARTLSPSNSSRARDASCQCA